MTPYPRHCNRLTPRPHPLINEQASNRFSGGRKAEAEPRMAPVMPIGAAAEAGSSIAIFPLLRTVLSRDTQKNGL